LKDAKDSVSSLIVTDHEIITGSLDARIRSYDIRQGTVTEDYVGGEIYIF
jgi:mitogen-activated protein kinase organizer 1